MRHKVYCTIATYSNGQLIRETPQNCGHKKIDEAEVFINADTEKDANLWCNVRVLPSQSEVSMTISGGKKYILDLTRFLGEIILNDEQFKEITVKVIADKLPHLK